MFTAGSSTWHVSASIARYLQALGMDEQYNFAAMLTVIEWEANFVLDDLPSGTLHDMVQNIATIARVLRLRFDMAPDLIVPPWPPEKS